MDSKLHSAAAVLLLTTCFVDENCFLLDLAEGTACARVRFVAGMTLVKYAY